MVPQIILYSNGREMGMVREGRTVPLPSQRYEKYRQALEEIRRQHQWKSSGTGAAFMGVALPQQPEGPEPVFRVGGMALLGGTLYYTAFIDGVGGLYTKDPLRPEAPEGVIVHRQGMHTVGLSWNGASFATTLRQGRGQHLAFLTLPRGDLTVVTEGDTEETGPAWSRDWQQVWFSSAGWGRAAGEEPALGPRSLCRLDANTMELTEVYAHPDYDCLLPREGADGSLWFLRRPRQQEKEGTSLADIAAAPGKVVRAMGGWLDLFTRRYAGEPLRSGGGKAKQRSEKDLIIEGNLINAQKALEENESSGERYPGIIPRSWELVRLAPGFGEGSQPEVAYRGVLTYALAPGGCLLSNGRHILWAENGGRPELLAEEPMVTMLAAEETA